MTGMVSMVSLIRLRCVLRVTRMSSLSRLSRVVRVSCMPLVPLVPLMLGLEGVFRAGGMRGVDHVLEGRAWCAHMLLYLLYLPGVTGVLRGRRTPGALKIIARAGLVGVIVVVAMGVVSVVTHVVAHIGR